MEWNETFSVPVSYSGSLADASQTLSLEKQKANTFFFPPFRFHPEISIASFFSFLLPHRHYSVCYTFFATESSFTVSQGALNVEGEGEKNMSKNSLAGLGIPISMLCVLKTCFKIGCRTGTRPQHRRSLNTCVMHLQTSWTCSNGASQSLHIHAPMDSSHFLHKFNDAPDAAQRDAQSPAPSGASEVFQRWERWRLGWERWRVGRHANWKRSLRFLMQPSGKEFTVNKFEWWLDDRSPGYIQVDQSDLFLPALWPPIAVRSDISHHLLWRYVQPVWVLHGSLAKASQEEPGNMFPTEKSLQVHVPATLTMSMNVHPSFPSQWNLSRLHSHAPLSLREANISWDP